jgi:hypothetical protein
VQVQDFYLEVSPPPPNGPFNLTIVRADQSSQFDPTMAAPRFECALDHSCAHLILVLAWPISQPYINGQAAYIPDCLNLVNYTVRESVRLVQLYGNLNSTFGVSPPIMPSAFFAQRARAACPVSVCAKLRLPARLLLWLLSWRTALASLCT